MEASQPKAKQTQHSVHFEHDFSKGNRVLGFVEAADPNHEIVDIDLDKVKVVVKKGVFKTLRGRRATADLQ
jgi:hypothetical protein